MNRARTSELPDEHALLDAVGKVYAATLDPSAWEDALVTLGRLLGADSGLLQVTQLPQVGYVGFGVDPERARTYLEHFATVDLYIPAAQGKAKPGEVIWDYEVVPPHEIAGTEIMEDYLRPQNIHGIRQSLGGILQNDARGIAYVQFVSRTRRRCLAPHADDTLRLLLPHILRAVHIQARLGEAQLAEATVDRLQVGVAFLDSQGRVLRMNRAARETLNAHDGLELRHGRLHAASRAEHTALERLIAQTSARRIGSDGPGGSLAIRRPSDRRPLSLTAVPSWPSVTLSLDTLGTMVVLLIADPEAGPPAAPPEMLCMLYGLTPAEARTALLVAEGRSPKEVAQALSVSVDTVRTVLKRVFAKTAVDRQAQLARLVARTLPPLRRDA